MLSKKTIIFSVHKERYISNEIWYTALPYDIFPLRENMIYYPFLNMPKAYIIARRAISYRRYITRSRKERISLRHLPYGGCLTVGRFFTDFLLTFYWRLPGFGERQTAPCVQPQVSLRPMLCQTCNSLPKRNAIQQIGGYFFHTFLHQVRWLQFGHIRYRVVPLCIALSACL